MQKSVENPGAKKVKNETRKAELCYPERRLSKSNKAKSERQKGMIETGECYEIVDRLCRAEGFKGKEGNLSGAGTNGGNAV